MKETYTADDGTQLSYHLIGEGSKHVLLVHGWMTSGLVYDGLAARLAESGYHVIVPDLRGAGASEESKSDYTLATYASDMKALLDHLGVEQCAVIGHSMGGQIAQLLALEAPAQVAKQALLCTVPAGGLPLPDDALGLFRSASNNAEALATILSMATLNLGEADKGVLVANAVKISDACLQRSLDAWTAGGFAQRLPETQAQTLVVASDDPFLPPDFLQQSVVDPIPSACMEIVKGAGHYPQLEAPDETARVILEFLASGV